MAIVLPIITLFAIQLRESTPRRSAKIDTSAIESFLNVQSAIITVGRSKTPHFIRFLRVTSIFLRRSSGEILIIPLNYQISSLEYPWFICYAFIKPRKVSSSCRINSAHALSILFIRLKRIIMQQYSSARASRRAKHLLIAQLSKREQ